MNKKASIFFWPFFILVLIVLSSFGLYTVFNRESAVVGNLYVGANQYWLTFLANSFEANNLFFEMASKNAYYDSVFYLYENGGKFNFDCGVEQGYVLWGVGDVDCFAYKKEFVDSFEKVFSSNLDVYTKNYIGLPMAGNIEFTYGENAIYFKTKNKLRLSKEGAIYEDYLYSRVDEGLLIDEILQVGIEAKSYSDSCKEDLSCYRAKTKESSFVWDIKNNGKLFMFDVNTNRKSGLFEKKDLIVRFGVDFRELNPLFR